MEAAKAAVTTALSSTTPLTPLFTTALNSLSSSDGSHRIYSNYLITTIASHLALGSYTLIHEDIEGAINPALQNLQAGGGLKGKDNAVRRQIYAFRLEEGEYELAATALAGMRVDDTGEGPYGLSPEETCDLHVTIAECYLAAEEPIQAEVFVNKAGHSVANVDNKKSWALLLRYRSTMAKVLDSNRKFQAAADKYFELSQTVSDSVLAEDLLQLLGDAVTCTILAPASGQRTRLLSLIGSDSRVASLDALPGYAAHSTIIMKMARNEVIQSASMAKFESELKEHQRVKTASGMTIVSRAVLEHNVGAVARIYASIRFEDLAKLLETDGTSAQGIAAKMCNSGVISATIDQVDGVLYFTEAVDGKSELKNDWNAAVRGFCVNMNECADKAKAAMEGAADMKQ